VTYIGGIVPEGTIHMSNLKNSACLALISCLITSFPARAADLKSENVVAKHVQSLGSAESLAAAKSRVAQGTLVYRVLVGGSGQLGGSAVIVSEGSKAHLRLKVPSNQYSGERFVCDGQKTKVAAAYVDKTYSEFGDFLKGQDVPLREGLLGGVLTTAWPLLNLESRKATVSYEGLRKVEGRELHVLRYKPRKNPDLSILMYFDGDTFRHVMTTYTASLQPRMGMTEAEASREQQSRYRIEERFSDFKTVDGLTLPSHYDLRFTEELSHGFTKSVEWDVTLNDVANNVSLDPRNFDIK